METDYITLDICGLLGSQCVFHRCAGNTNCSKRLPLNSVFMTFHAVSPFSTAVLITVSGGKRIFHVCIYDLLHSM
jgi:hypothetical protein